MQIALVACMVFAGIWFVALRPKPIKEAAATAPPVGPIQVKTGTGAASGFGNVAARAQKGVAEANQKIEQNAATQNKAGSTDQAPVSTPVKPVDRAKLPKSATGVAKVGGTRASDLASSTTIPARPRDADTSEPVAALPRPVRAALDAKKVIVLLFWQSGAPEDRAVRDEVAKVDRHGGAVKFVVAPIRDVGRYGRITAGVDVLQSPTVLVIDRQKHARKLTGYIDSENVEQAVTTALVRR